MKWDYIRYLRNRKRLDITVETLKDSKQLAKIFQLSTANKTVFFDLKDKMYDKNRNAHYKKICILDNLAIKTSEIGNMNDEIRNSHYKSENIDDNIIRQNYYRYLETGNMKYLQNFKSSCTVAGYNLSRILNSILRFNYGYKGNRTQEVCQRMQYSQRFIADRGVRRLKNGFISIAQKLNDYLFGYL
jgi:hypothetical protein